MIEILLSKFVYKYIYTYICVCAYIKYEVKIWPEIEIEIYNDST